MRPPFGVISKASEDPQALLEQRRPFSVNDSRYLSENNRHEKRRKRRMERLEKRKKQDQR